MSLVVFTGYVGLAVAPAHLHPLLQAVAVLCLAVGPGATGDVGWGAVALFAIVFFWTPPHFWALALTRAGEYAAAGVPMLPVVAGARETRRQMLLYTLMLWPATLMPWLLGIAGLRYAVV